jgi:hypothetical protein
MVAPRVRGRGIRSLSNIAQIVSYVFGYSFRVYLPDRSAGVDGNSRLGSGVFQFIVRQWR